MKIKFINTKMTNSIKKQLGIILATSSCCVASLVILPQFAKAQQITSPDGTSCDGKVQNGKLNGQGVCKYADGAVYEGNFVDGKPINKAGSNILSRTVKTVLGGGGTEAPSKEGQFLIDIEFDMLPQFNVASNGVEYTSSEQAELKTLMGEDGYFNRELNRIMRAAEDVTYITPDGQTITGYVNVMRHFRRSGNTEASLETYSRIVPRVESLLRRSMKRVEYRLSTYNRIKEEGSLQNQINQSAKAQQDQQLNELLEIN